MFIKTLYRVGYGPIDIDILHIPVIKYAAQIFLSVPFNYPSTMHDQWLVLLSGPDFIPCRFHHSKREVMNLYQKCEWNGNLAQKIRHTMLKQVVTYLIRAFFPSKSASNSNNIFEPTIHQHRFLSVCRSVCPSVKEITTSSLEVNS